MKAGETRILVKDLANDLKTLTVEYMKGDVLFNEVINLVDDIAGGRSFTLGKS
jgi:hypothetical protein